MEIITKKRLTEKLTSDELAKLLAICSINTEIMAKTFFPDRFFAEFSDEVHGPIFELIDSEDRHVAIAAPRGFGKTSIVGLAKAAQKILFRQCNFMPYVSHSFENALLQTENLKRELITNKLIRDIFGGIKAKALPGDMEEAFSKKSWVTSTGVLVLPRGSGQQIRGLLYKDSRPDLIIIDDLEDPDTITSDDIREKRKVWFNADLLKCVSRMDLNYKIIYIDTLKHQLALLEDLLSDKSGKWRSVRLEAFDDNLQTKAPSFMTNEQVKEEYDYHKEHGILDVLARELRNRPIAGEDAAFKQNMFKDYDEKDLQGKELTTFIIVDPAKEPKLHSADSAVVAVSIDQTGQAYYVRDVVAGKMYPDELYDEMFLMQARFKAVAVGVEVTSLHQFISQPIKNEIVKRGANFIYLELHAKGKKEHRIAQLVPYYRNGYMYHNPERCVKLEMQLLEFPRPSGWDVMDALGYLPEMLDRGALFFEPPEEDYGNIEAEYEQMEKNDDEVIENWRIC